MIGEGYAATEEATASAFHFSVPSSRLTSSGTNQIDPSRNTGSDQSSSPSSASASVSADVPTPLYSPTTPWDDQEPTSGGAPMKPRPPPATRGYSFASGATLQLTENPASMLERQRRVSTSVLSTATGTLTSAASTQSSSPHTTAGATPMTTVTEGHDIWNNSSLSATSPTGQDNGSQRTARAASDGLLVQSGFSPTMADASLRGREKSEGDAAALIAEQQERAAMFREHERRSLESSAQSRFAATSGAVGSTTSSRPALFTRDSAVSPSGLSMSSTAGSPFFQPAQPASSASVTPMLSPTSQEASGFSFKRDQATTSSTQPAAVNSSSPATSPTESNGASGAGSGRPQSASLHLGDLDPWMDEAYIRECCAWLGWDNVVNIKLIRGSSPSSGYCFLTFPSAAHAAEVLARFNAAPPMMMPRSGRTFKLNWGTGLPGLQPRWDGEYSVFVGDLGREVTEGDLVALFTPIFPSTKSAKVMCDPSTGLSRGYGFVRFSDENDMHRALALGQNTGSGLSLHGRTLRISEASGPNNAVTSGGDRDRSKARGLDQLSMPPPSMSQSKQAQDGVTPNGGGGNTPDYLSPSGAGPGPLTPGFNTRSGPLSPGSTGASGGSNQASDPNNTTVFVGGLPACISEETLRSFFHHFGDITYCKIPPGKGCGFVQFVRRADAELAIAKMNDFPIHGKSRIRLSWGRSQGDKQVEHVRKLAAALGVPFESVWKMVQGQDNSTIKQIATAVGPNGQPSGLSSSSSRFDGRTSLGAVASAAGLSESEVKELVNNRSLPSSSFNSPMPTTNAFSPSSTSASDGPTDGLNSHSSRSQHGSNGPYSRVSPSSFSSFAHGPSSNGMPLSPPPSAGPNGHGYSQFSHQQQQPFGGSQHAPYNAVRPDGYTMQQPASPYERVEFDEGRRPMGFTRLGNSYDNVGGASEGSASYTDTPLRQNAATGLEESFGDLSFRGPTAFRGMPGPPPPPPHMAASSYPGQSSPHHHHNMFNNAQQASKGRFSSPAGSSEFYAPPPQSHLQQSFGPQSTRTPLDDGAASTTYGYFGSNSNEASTEPQWSAGWNNNNNNSSSVKA
ncbi:hypothetical protein OIO90_004797 [Microbotryomycetes sp. JL221]|nr:hypothetical protein OIO90_004797 [Microbotryomycetes sp. JL221]